MAVALGLWWFGDGGTPRRAAAGSPATAGCHAGRSSVLATDVVCFFCQAFVVHKPNTRSKD